MGGDTTKALFGDAFWEKARWARYGSANNLTTGGTMAQHFLNDEVIKDLLASKPEDWERLKLSSGISWGYVVKNQFAFTVKSLSQTHRIWAWRVADKWTRPTGVMGPVVFIEFIHTNNPNSARSVCAWYESNE